MAASGKMYSSFPLNLAAGSILALNGTATTVNCALLTSSYTFDQESHSVWADVSSYEVVAGGSSGSAYVSGGTSLAGKSLTETSRVTKFDADDVSWNPSTITAQYCVLYETSNNKLILCQDFGDSKSSSIGAFVIQWNESGIFTMTVGA